MARPPRRTVRKLPGNSVAGQPLTAADDVQATAGVSRAAVDPEAVLADFETALRNEPGIGEEGLEFLMPFLRDAVEQASLQPLRADIDPGAWMSAFDGIVGESLPEDERNALVRRLNEAVEPLADQKTQVALEFARRIQSEGEAAAIAWLEEHKKLAGRTDPQAPPPAAGDRPPIGAQAITRSRSRRLRGPPA